MPIAGILNIFNGFILLFLSQFVLVETSLDFGISLLSLYFDDIYFILS